MEEIKETQEETKVYTYTGTVRRYNAEKGYGFIRSGSRADIFFHASQLTDRNVIPQKNDKVGFMRISASLKGQIAEEVTIIKQVK